MFAHCAILLISGVLAAVAQEPTYPRSDLLVEIETLAKPDLAKKFRIVDARTLAKYRAGHVPGAVWVNHDSWSKAIYAKQDPKEWSDKIGDLGIDNQTRVLIYDDAFSKDAARIWWVLRYWGVKDVRLLNGGFPAYVGAHLPLSKEEVIPNKAGYSNALAEPSRFADKDKMQEILRDKKTQIIDARSAKEYCGEEKLQNKKGGAIPGALNLEWTEALDSKTQKFKSPAELTKILNNSGIDLNKPAVTHCQSGGRAAVMAFTLELMGAKEVANYYRGWSEWGNAQDTPIISPKKNP